MTYFINSFTNEEVKKIISQENEDVSKNYIEALGYCHAIRLTKKIIFVVLRKELTTIQLIIFKSEKPEIFNKFTNLKLETIIYITGNVVESKIKTCTVTNYEVKLSTLNIISIPKENPIFSLDDANETYCSDNKDNSDERCKVGRQLRLDNRWLDLRIPINQHIFRLRSGLEACLRNQLISEDFIEIHTPKIIPAVSEGGSNVFEVNYFGKCAYLAQSPQLYKQILINSDFEKVFEIGPVFRAEKANTYRHLCEFTGLDIEFIIKPYETYIKIIENIWTLLHNSFTTFETKYHDKIDYLLKKTSAPKLIFPKEPVIITFENAAKLLNKAGFEQDPLDDIGSINEKHLGVIIYELYKTDVYVLSEFPNLVRPFYTLPLNDKYSGSFDFMMRGNEIASGAQRINDHILLKKNIDQKGIKLDGSSGLEDYVKSFESGSMPHGGCGIGLERLVMLYFGLGNIRTTTLFPRDPKRITP